jgi:tRNA threonylcarbamoyladenosine biosynthesis protein TsaB
MALLLNIDTATEQAGVCLSRDEEILALEETPGKKNHASFIQPAIQRVLQTAGCSPSAVNAIAVTGGPGSYTGLRVGLATAKGLCYALGKPLIMINTLEVMAKACVLEEARLYGEDRGVLFCPMIDARRMEVFTALYTAKLEVVMEPTAMVLDETSFQHELGSKTIIFSGSGSLKAKVIQHSNAVFSGVSYSVKHLAALALLCYNASQFSDLAYSEPFYLKEFYKKA